MIQNAIGGFFGDFWEAYNRPTRQARIETRLELENRQKTHEQMRQQAFLDNVAALQKQKREAEALAQNPGQLPSTLQPTPTWTEADELYLIDAFNRAGINREEVAKASQAELAADAFKRGLANITNDAALVNIGMGKEYKPVELEGGVFYNPYDTQNFNLGSTQKHQAETKLEQAKAAEQALRLANIRALKDPLMQINATSNKELGEPIEAELQGPNGETHMALITQDSSGGYHHATVTDRAGKPLVIPPEASGQGLTSEQINIQNRAKLLGISEADALSQMIHSKTDSPEATFNNLYDVNRKDDTNMERDPKERLQKTMMEFAMLYPDLPIPGIDARIKRTISDEKDQAELLTLAQQLNSNLANKAPPPPPPVVNQSMPTVTPTVNEQPVTQPQANSSAPVVDQLIHQSQAGQQPASGLTLNQPPAAIPEPLPESLEQAPLPSEPAQQLQPLTAQSINDAWQMINSGEDPQMVRNGLAMNGYDMSPQAINRLTIDAINAGVPADLFQKYLASIGLAPTG